MAQLIDRDALYQAIREVPASNALLDTLNREDALRAVLDAPTVAIGDRHVSITWTPDFDKMVRDVAYRGLNEFRFNGKSIREWVEIILEWYAQTKWVSVEDRLPEKYGPYLVVYGGTEINWLKQAVRYWTGDKDGDYWRGAEAGSRITGITHWRELPEPPKDEIEEILDE